MQNIELASENPFLAQIENSSRPSVQPNPEIHWDAISEILAIAVLRNRFRRQHAAD
ncbi:MAG: hypothetical protein V3V05_09870 [Pontiella sp.]